jgi:hypothetical protein
MEQILASWERLRASFGVLRFVDENKDLLAADVENNGLKINSTRKPHLARTIRRFSAMIATPQSGPSRSRPGVVVSV